MNVHIEIDQIDNGFIVSLFDSDAIESISDVHRFVKTKDEVLEILTEWWKGPIVGTFSVDNK